MTTMAGKTCLVTGATGGIGLETAVRLAALGADVVVAARVPERGEWARAEIGRRVPGARVEAVSGDLADLAQVRDLAAQVVSRFPRLDVLVNNAGVIGYRHRLTVDGFEATFATNHLGPFLLTTLLRDLLVRSAPARVVTVASAVHKSVRAIAWDELPRGENPQAYAVSKLLNILFTAELAQRVARTGVTATCLHPGFVRSDLGRDVTGAFGALVKVLLPFQRSAAAGAVTPVYLATSSEVDGVSGQYFVRCKATDPSALARDPDAAARLWALSEQLTRP